MGEPGKLLGRFPREDFPQKRACKVCGHEASYLLSIYNEHGEPQLLDLFLCPHCGLLFVGNPITLDQLAYAYGTLDWKKYYQEIAIATGGKVACAVNDLYSLFSNPGDRDSVLDVGCGYGHFLEVFKGSRPFVRVAGHELQGEPASACEAKGFKVFTCNLEEISDKFDLIVLLDVAEHVPDPNRTFAACHSLLKMGGHIYIHTPRRCFWDSFFLVMAKIPGMRQMSKAWLRTRVSIFHLQLWTDRALELSLKMAGFQLVYLKPELELSWPLERYSRIYLGEKLSVPAPLVRMATSIADLLFVRLGTLKNKAICLGQRKESRDSFV